MQKLLVSHFSLLFALIISCVASGQFHGFPVEIQSRLDSGEFEITDSDVLGFGIGSSPFVGAYFEYLDHTQSPPQERVIIRYNIGEDSVFSSTFSYDTTVIDMTGIVHLDASKRYSGPPYAFTLYLEKMDQVDEIIGGIFPHQTIRLAYLNAEALLGGVGSYRDCLIYDKYECTEPDDLSSQDTPQICLAKGCEISATFRLNRISYIPNGTDLEIDLDVFGSGQTEFPPLYEQRQSFPGFPDYEPDQSQSLLQRFELAEVQRGDVNRDGAINLLDIDRFVELLVAGDYRFEADVNEDLQFNLLDIAGFVSLISP